MRASSTILRGYHDRLHSANGIEECRRNGFQGGRQKHIAQARASNERTLTNNNIIILPFSLIVRRRRKKFYRYLANERDTCRNNNTHQTRGIFKGCESDRDNRPTYTNIIRRTQNKREIY